MDTAEKITLINERICGFDEKGLPIGCQLIGPPLGESKVLGAAHAFQLDTDYHKRRPGRGQAEKKEAV